MAGELFEQAIVIGGGGFIDTIIDVPALVCV